MAWIESEQVKSEQDARAIGCDTMRPLRNALKIGGLRKWKSISRKLRVRGVKRWKQLLLITPLSLSYTCPWAAASWPVSVANCGYEAKEPEPRKL